MYQQLIDGSGHLGTYRVTCDCSAFWNGAVHKATDGSYSPALPIAEVCVHMRMAHSDQVADIRFSERFSEWLIKFWELESAKIARAGVVTQAREWRQRHA